MFRKGYLIVALILVVSCLGCGLFSDNGSDAEVVFAPTEVGTPEGDKVTKQIGPAGGTLASADGRLTLTVPQNALPETVAFSIQPITNKAGNGLGLAYRLEPNGKTFTTPLELSVRYNDHDLEGTVPEAFSLAYQDNEGAWHAQMSAKLDQAAKTLTVSATHFTDFAILARHRIEPVHETVLVGNGVRIRLVACEKQGIVDKILSRKAQCSNAPPSRIKKWGLRGQGTIADDVIGVMYMAPSKKPTPDNFALVDCTVEFEFWDPDTGRVSRITENFTARITIVDRGYKATGKAGDTVFSGDICDLEKPFTIKTNNRFLSSFEFVPSSPTTGTWSFSGKSNLVGGGGGEYTIEGTDALKTGIAMNGSSSGYGQGSGRRTPTLSGGGPMHIDLVPLDKECGGG